MHTRMKSHKSKFRSKTLKVREGSAFYIHMVNEHPDTELEGKSIDIFFEVKILKAYQKVLTRLVDEGTNLNCHEGPVLNSKTEWHQPKIIRNVIIQGGAENRGLRSYRSPSPTITQAATNLVSYLTSYESSRTTQRRHVNAKTSKK